jgi:molybdate transport system substrate-binding protein
MKRWPLALVLACVPLAGCGGGPRTEDVLVYAAASTREALEQVAADFRAQTGIPVHLNLGPSSTLARQIERGAPADLFLSADEDWADFLGKSNLIDRRQDLLTNRLVVIVPADSALAFHDLKGLAAADVKLALAGPAVPAGHYAEEALKNAGVWDKVRDRVLRAVDVRAALAYVAQGEAGAGLVYETDTLGVKKVRIALKVPPELHTPIRYPLVLVRHEHVKDAARQFYEYLGSEAAAEVFRRAGFGVVR